MLKKSFLVVLIFILSSISISANVINSNKYKIALSQYKSNNYFKSYELFENLFWDNLEDPDVNFYLGSSAYYIKKYDEALSAYERITIKYPEDQEVWFEIAKTYYMQKNYLKSKEILDKIKEEKSTKELLNDVRKYKLLLDDKLAKYTFKANILVGFGKNSNVNNKNKNEVSKTFHQELLGINFRYNFNSEFSFKNNLILINKKISSHEGIKALFYKPSLEKIYDEYLIDYAFLYEKINIGSDTYLNNYSFVPKIVNQYRNDIKINTILKFTKSKYNETNKNKNSKSYGIKILINKINSHKVTFNPSIYINKSRNDGGTYYKSAYTKYGINLSYNYVYNKNIILNPSLNYEKIKYKDDNPTYSKIQKDSKIKIGISGIYFINKTLFTQLYIDSTKLNSTINEEEYKTTVIGININKSF